MIRYSAAFVVLAALLFTGCPAKADGIVGTWSGVLDIAGTDIRVVVHVSEEDGELSALMDSPDQGASDIEVSAISFKNDTLKLEVEVARSTYIGVLGEDGKVVGKWSQMGRDMDLVLDRGGDVEPIVRPQDPVKPYPYVEEEVQFDNPAGMVTLAGTLTLPKGEGPFPAAVLISGSGPQNRDEELFGHKPFLVLADHLTREGIAVLRYDDRGVGNSGGTLEGLTSLDLATDVSAAVEYLVTREDIDPMNIGLIGHSEGGVIAPLAADLAAYVVLMAGTGVTGEEVLYEQGRLIRKASGADADVVAWQRKLQERMFALAKTDLEREVLVEQLADTLRAVIADMPLTAAATFSTELPDEGIELQAQMVASTWFRHFLVHDPAPALGKLTVPVLALVGEKDVQVSPGQNLPAIEQALKRGGNPDYTVKELPGLNHLFQTAETGSVSEYAQIDETIAPLALETISGWILERVGE